MEAAQEQTQPCPVPPLLSRLRDHFGTDPARLPVLEQEFEPYQQANLHLTITDLFRDGPAPTLVGVVTESWHNDFSLAKFSRPTSARNFDEGPVEYVDVTLANDQRLACVKQGLYLFRVDDQPVALLVAHKDAHRLRSALSVAVMAADRDTAELIARRVSKGVRYGPAFRGKVLSIERGCFGDTTIRFHHLPEVRREDVILPETLLRRIERQAIGMTAHADRLKAAGRHLKRGILLHGKPGTGKTLSAMYLVSRTPDRTVMVITGGGVGAIEAACGLARLLQPATIVLEDVDLIGTERENQMVGANALLFELLNQMDGLGEDTDVLFVLTTNRPDHLEPALAARPGRVDLAIEVPLPDADCRRRLLALYGKGLELALTDPEKWVSRTEGVSGAFIRELLRKAAVIAAEDDGGTGQLVVADRHVEEAIAELLVAGGPLTQALLGASGAASR